MTSLLRPNPDVLNLFHGFTEWGAFSPRRRSRQSALMTLWRLRGLEPIKIDIQGGELMALRNAKVRLHEALVIQTEVEFLPMYIDQPLFSEVASFLGNRGSCSTASTPRQAE